MSLGLFICSSFLLTKVVSFLLREVIDNLTLSEMDIYKVSRILADNCPGFIDSVELFISEIGVDWNQDKFKKLSYFGSSRADSIKVLLTDWISSQPSQANISNLIKILTKIKFCSEQLPIVDILEEIKNLDFKTGQCVICEKDTDLKCMGCSKGGIASIQIPFYCGKEHQVEHWKGGHKKSCGKSQITSKLPHVVDNLLELEKTYKKLGPADILGDNDLQVVAEILSDNPITMDNWREVMSMLGVLPDKYDEWEATCCPTLYLMALKTLKEWREAEKTLQKLITSMGYTASDALDNLIKYGFSLRRVPEQNIKRNIFKKGSIITGIKRNLSEEELERVVCLNFEVPYANLDIMEEIIDCGKLVEKSVKDIYLQVQDWDEGELEQCTNIYKMLMNPENKILPYNFCGEGDDHLEKLIVTAELKTDDRLQGFGRDLMPRKYRNVYVN